MLKAVRVLAIAAVSRAAGRLYIGSIPGFGTNRPQEGSGVEGARADFHIERLKDDTTLFCPVLLQSKDQALKGRHIGCRLVCRDTHRGKHRWP